MKRSRHKDTLNGEVQQRMTTDYVDYHRHLEERLAQLGRELPGPMTGFARLQ